MSSNVYFDPPLCLQRQSWILSKIRQERVDTVVDVGCANAALISALMQPAFQSDKFPLDRFPLLAREGSEASGSRALLPQRHWIYASADINMSRVAGLDIDATMLKNSRSALSLHGQVLAENRPRWRSLEVKLLQGPIELENEALSGYDAFVATETIEHLDEPALSQLGPTILGKYRPRLLLLTTPNYYFNENFGDNLSTRPGYPDPTGRTDRVFRHKDHKFEWTPEEFARWCEAVAGDFGYEVVVGGIGEGIYRRQAGVALGKPHSARPRTGGNENERLRFASQTACFRRLSASPRSVDERDAGAAADESEAGYFSIDASLNLAGSTLPSSISLGAHGEEDDDNDDDNDDDEADERKHSRKARSRRTENLPFLSSPSPASAFIDPSRSGDVPKAPSPATPSMRDASFDIATAHRLLWDQRYPCSDSWGLLHPPPNESSGSDSRKARKQPEATVALPAADIVAKVLEKQRQLFIAAQWSEFDEGGAKLQDGSAAWEAKVKLLDLWCDDTVRAACGGKVTALLEALQLSAPKDSGLAHRVGSLSLGAGDAARQESGRSEWEDITVGTNGQEWDLRVVVHHHYEQQDADPSVAADEAPATDSDLWLVYSQTATVKAWFESIKEARKWIPESYTKPWKGAKGSHGPNIAPASSWD